MRLPIDTSAMTFLCATPPAAVVDFESRRQKADTETGELLYAVQLVALAGDGAEIVKVTVAGEPKLTSGAPVTVSGLTANYWAMGDRSGLSFRAAKVQPATATAASGTGANASTRAAS